VAKSATTKVVKVAKETKSEVVAKPTVVPTTEPVPVVAHPEPSHSAAIMQKLVALKDTDLTEEEKFIQYVILYDKYTTAVVEGEAVSKSLYHQITIGLADTLEEFYELVMHHLEEAKPFVGEDLKEKIAGLVNILGEYGRAAGNKVKPSQCIW
jgi:hypothetical protein